MAQQRVRERGRGGIKFCTSATDFVGAERRSCRATSCRAVAEKGECGVNRGHDNLLTGSCAATACGFAATRRGALFVVRSKGQKRSPTGRGETGEACAERTHRPSAKPISRAARPGLAPKVEARLTKQTHRLAVQAIRSVGPSSLSSSPPDVTVVPGPSVLPKRPARMLKSMRFTVPS